MPPSIFSVPPWWFLHHDYHPLLPIPWMHFCVFVQKVNFWLRMCLVSVLCSWISVHFDLSSLYLNPTTELYIVLCVNDSFQWIEILSTSFRTLSTIFIVLLPILQLVQTPTQLTSAGLQEDSFMVIDTLVFELFLFYSKL